MKRRRRSIYAHRPLSAAERNRWNAAADELLAHARDIFELSCDFDTAVRDSISQGLAFIVWASFDCRSIALDISETNSRNAFIDTGVAEWFREREYAEWFCYAASSMFHTSRPRTLGEVEILVRSIGRRTRRNSRAPQKPKVSK